MMPRRSLCCAAACAVLLVVRSSAQAQPKGEIRLAVGSRPGNLIYLQVDLAQALGLFAQEGLRVRTLYVDGGVAAAKALVDGQADFSGNTIDFAARERTGGRPLKMIVSFTNLPMTTLLVRRDLKPQIHSPCDLRGRRVGVSALGAGSHVLLASILHRAGCSLSSVEVVPVGIGASFVAAMRQKKIDAGVSSDPATTELMMAGEVSVLRDLVTSDETDAIFGGGYQFTGMLTTVDLIRNRPQVASAMVRAFVKANRYIQEHSAAEIVAQLPPGIVGDRYIYVKGLQHSRRCYSKDGMIAVSGVANNVQSQVIFGAIPVSERVPPNELFDLQFVEKALRP